jgi:hypothetical protein
MNMKQYHKMLMQQTEVRKIVEQHFDSYAQEIDIAAYHPLKTIDSIPRFRDKIIEIIEKWENSESIIHRIAVEYAEANNNDIETSTKMVYQMIHDIIDIYLGIDDINLEIDNKHKSYVRASHERIRTLLYTDKSIKGMLVEILNNLPKMRTPNTMSEVVYILNKDLPLYSVENINESSLYTERIKRERGNEKPLKEEGEEAYREAFKTMASIQDMVTQGLFLMDVNNYIKEVLANRNCVNAKDISIDSMQDFMRLIFAVIKQHEPDSEYHFQFHRQRVWVGNVYLPDFILTLKSFASNETNQENEANVI